MPTSQSDSANGCQPQTVSGCRSRQPSGSPCINCLLSEHRALSQLLRAKNALTRSKTHGQSEQ